MGRECVGWGWAGVGWRVVVKQQKCVKCFTGNFQFNFCAPTKKQFFATLLYGIRYFLSVPEDTQELQNKIPYVHRQIFWSI